MCLQRRKISKTFIRNTLLVATGLIAATISSTSYAFVRLSTGANPLFWAGTTANPISFVVRTGTVNNISQASYEGAVRRSFQAWEDIEDSSIRFQEDTNPGSKARGDFQADDIHTVMFDTTNASGFFGNSGLVAVTPVEFQGNGTITDADIILNARNHTFSTTGQAAAFDVQSVVTHEVGHFIGLDHSPILGATMVPFALQEAFLQRSLEIDDKAAVTTVYPSIAGISGKLRGRIVRSGGGALSGAHVVAQTEDGAVAVGTVTNGNGDFVIDGLSTQQSYTVFAEPLDGPVVAGNLSTGISGLEIDSNFGTTFYGSFNSPTQFVPAAGSGFNIGTLNTREEANPQKMNITTISTTRFVIGSSTNVTLSSSNLRSTDELSISSGDLQLDNIQILGSFGTQIRARVTVPEFAQPGLYTFRVHRSNSNDTVVLTGSIEVVRASPTAETVTPNSADANSQALVSIFGAGFVEGLKVIVGNTIIDNAAVFSEEEVQFTLENIPAGTHDVRVENPDGQFALLANALVITGTSPTPAPTPAATGGGGGGGGGGGCDVGAGPLSNQAGLGSLLPFAILLLLLAGMRRRF